MMINSATGAKRTMKNEITSQQKEQYREEGYFILEGAMDPQDLAGLRQEASRFIEMMHAEMDRQGKDVLGINHRNNRYFISNRNAESTLLQHFLFSDLMAEVCRATLGPEALLFNEQYVIKAAERGMKFGWHQDSGYVGHANHKPYLSCWCPLDDVSEENGTVYVLPYSRSGTRAYVPHKQEDVTNDMVGYFGDDPGIPVVCPAGSVVAFSSTLFHRSGTNTTDVMRRVYLSQYAQEPITNADGSKTIGLAVPFLHEGRVVHE